MITSMVLINHDVSSSRSFKRAMISACSADPSCPLFIKSPPRVASITRPAQELTKCKAKGPISKKLASLKSADTVEAVCEVCMEEESSETSFVLVTFRLTV